MRPQWPFTEAEARRRRRLRAVFEGRSKQLEEARLHDNANAAGPRRYGAAVTRYTRARTAWRAIRGWS